jgi:hypothetical protein
MAVARHKIPSLEVAFYFAKRRLKWRRDAKAKELFNLWRGQ